MTKYFADDAAADDWFGASADIDGDTIIVGACCDDDDGEDAGSAYIFVKSGDTWSPQQKLTAGSDGAAEDYYGDWVAISGDTAIVGADYDDNDGTNSGSAYIYTRSGSTWSLEQKLTAGSTYGDAEDYFGWPVDIDGNTVVIGACGDESCSGSAYIYTRSGSTWSLEKKLDAGTDAAESDYYGDWVAISGDTVLVGASDDDNDDGVDSGSAYVYTRSGSTWSLEQKLTAGSTYGNAEDYFGWRLALDGDTAVIASVCDDDNGENSGSVYVYTRSGTTWSLQQKLTADDGAEDDWFGDSVAISGDTIIVGAEYDDDNGTSSGSAYVFTRSGGTWTQAAKIIPDDGAEDDYFGWPVAIDENTAVIGACGNDDKDSEAGSIYILE